MPSVEVKELHNYSRFPNSLAFLLYLPIGILLVLLRLIIFLPTLLLSTLLPNTSLVNGVLQKLLCVTFGISVNVENLEKKEDVEAYISNQISIFDHLVVHSITGSFMPGNKVDTQLSPIMGLKYFGRMTNFETFKNAVALFMSANKTPLYFQPESAMTNGRAVLKFASWPFTLCSKIQPVAIDVRRPLLNTSVTSISSSYWSDLFCFMFSPLTVYNVQFLPPAERKGMSEAEFASRMQKEVARGLKVDAVELSAGDMREWVKRYQVEQQRAQRAEQMRASGASTAHSVQLQRMGLQVKEVLPMVPMAVIMRDLAKTRNVDITITNILEGIVHYIPEQPSPSPSSSGMEANDTNKPASSSASQASTSNASSGPSSTDPFNTAASSFGKSASERSLSFHERKKLLIENARRRYIEKHGLSVVALNNC